MFKTVKDLFKEEKLSVMLDFKNDTVHFPSRVAEKNFKADVDSALALGFATVLRAGFDSKNLDLKVEKDFVTVNFNGKEIQKILFLEVGEGNFSKEISQKVKERVAKEKADKVTCVFFNKEKVLSHSNALSEYLSNLRSFIDKNDSTVEKVREYSIEKSGMYIEEYENKKLLLNESEVLNANLISHHNTFSVPIIYEVNNLQEFKARRYKNGEYQLTGEFHLETKLTYGVDTPIYAYNPIVSVTNYRDIDMEVVARNITDYKKENNFLDTLIQQANEYYQYEKELNNPKNSTLIKKAIKSKQNSSLMISGGAKKLFSMAPQDEILERDCEEIKVYEATIKNNDYVCINSKGTCLGNGQHSTTTFNIINLLLNYNDETSLILKHKYDLNESKMAKLFGLNANRNPYEKASLAIVQRIEKSGLTKEQFLEFFNKTLLKVDWEVASNQKNLASKITIDNAHREQDKSDDWLNENKEYISSFITTYNNVNKKEIKKYDEIRKDENHPFSKFGTTMALTAIKTPELAPQISNNFIDYVNINSIYECMSFMLPKNKNNSPLDNPYTDVADLSKTESRENLRNVYQSSSMSDTEIYKIFQETLNGRFLKTQLNNAFDNFLTFANSEIKPKNMTEENKNKRFLELGKAAIENQEMLKKIPAIILFKDMSEFYYNNFEKVCSNKINRDNFIKLCFASYVSKVGKKNFNLDNVEKIGELILKDFSLGLQKYYSEETAVISDQLKRKDLYKAVEELPRIKELAVDLFEPYCDARISGLNNYDVKLLRNTKYKSLSSAIADKKEQIENSYLEYFGSDDDLIKRKKMKF